ncbi:hypothetical protein BROUX41_000821 [Berkeleyomyces rouxiae]
MLTKFFLLAPAVLASAVPRQTNCSSDTLPTKYTITDFAGTSSDNGSSYSALAFKYTSFSSSGTLSATINCSYDPSTVPVTIPGRTNRWACDDPLVQFIYSSGRLAMVQKTCIQDGSPSYEASGSVRPAPSCSGDGSDKQCVQAQINGVFSSISPAAKSS